jgi:hypothetical protein
MSHLSTFGRYRHRETQESSFIIAGKIPGGGAGQFVSHGEGNFFYGMRRDYLVFKTFDLLTFGIGVAVSTTAAFFAVKHGLETAILLQSPESFFIEGVGHGIAAVGSGLFGYTLGGITRSLTGLRYGGLARTLPIRDATPTTLDAVVKLSASYSNAK